MIRTLWYYIVLVVSGIVHAGGSAIAGLLHVPLRRGGVYDWAGTGWARDVLRAAGTPVLVEGLDNIPRSQPVMYARPTARLTANASRLRYLETPNGWKS